MPQRPKSFSLKTPATKKVSFKLSYDAAYKKVRDQVVQEEPLCRACITNGHVTPGAQVDHIIPIAEGGTHARTNLQHLCEPCHKAKTLRDMQRQRRGW